MVKIDREKMLLVFRFFKKPICFLLSFFRGYENLQLEALHFKSDCDFNDFDEKRADFIYQNAIKIWEALNNDILLLKQRLEKVLLVAAVTIFMEFVFLSTLHPGLLRLLVLATILAKVIICCRLFFGIFPPITRYLPFLSPTDLLSKDFNYDEGGLIKTPKWKLKILQDIIYDIIVHTKIIRGDIARIFNNGCLFLFISTAVLFCLICLAIAL